MSDTRENNSVFTNTEDSTQGKQPAATQQLSQNERMKRELGFEIPVEAIPLPSKGRVYSEESHMHLLESVDVRAMTARDEDILMSRAFIKNGTVITKLLEACIVDKRYNVLNMLSGDRNAVLIGLRTIGYGQEYKVGINCPECNVKIDATFDLAEIPLKPLEIEPVSEGENLFSYTLPMSKLEVVFRFLTGKDEEFLTKLSDRKKKKGLQAGSMITDRLKHQIVSVSGESKPTLIDKFVRNMLARDSLGLRKYIEKHEPGVDMKDWVSCDSCDWEGELSIPLGATFFWPDTE
jgi:hypothetical protein